MPDPDPDDVADLIEQRIAPLRDAAARQFATLHPLEAIYILGGLVAQTINRFPDGERHEMLTAFCDELQDKPDAT